MDNDAGDAEDGENDVASGKADSPAEGGADARAILALVNDPSVMEYELDKDAGLSARVAEAIITHRKGADTYADTADDDMFETLAELDAIHYLGPTAMTSLLRYARKTATKATLTVELVANEWTSGNGDRAVKLSSLNPELVARGLAPFPEKITLGGRDDRQFNNLLAEIEVINEKLGRNLELQRGWDPSEYVGLCYSGPLNEVGPVVENLQGSLIGLYTGIQAWRWSTTKKLFGFAAESGESEWLRSQREDNENGDDADAWEHFDTASKDFLMMADGGQEGDGTELFAVTIPACP
jgi:hypothetical protein